MSLTLIKNWNGENYSILLGFEETGGVKNKIHSSLPEDSWIAGFNVRRDLEITHF